MSSISIRPLLPSDRERLRLHFTEQWGGETIIVHGQVFHYADLDGFAAVFDRQVVGLITCRLEPGACEIMTLSTWNAGAGYGRELINAVGQHALSQGCRRLYLMTTNDNTRALRFYQRFGFTIAAVRLDVIQASRRLKPAIPLTGEDGIPIRDEIELEMWLE